MTNDTLSSEPITDFANLELDYEAFRALAINPHLDLHGKIGFPTAYRDHHEPAILADIAAKLPYLEGEREKLVLDIGPGCANLPRMIIDLCRRQAHRVVLVDSPEMLQQLPPEDASILKCPGRFPTNSKDVVRRCGGPVDVVICYSVLHYIFVDGNPFDFVDAIVELLAPGGQALIGDIPNISKRNRFFASRTGQAFHKQFTGDANPPAVHFNQSTPGKIDDGVLAGIVHRCQLAGCDAYLVPQPANLPSANRRDDLLILKP